MKGARVTLLLSAVCLILAITSVGLGLTRSDAPPHTKLAEGVPMRIADWQGEDVSLGDLEIRNATTRLLNYDDYVYRVYRRGDQEIFVYAMYWRQGSVSVREIAGHTPDGCWIANGARLALPKAVRGLTVGGRQTAPAEIREFVFPGEQHINAVWWHLWGGDLVGRDFDRKAFMPTLKELWIWLGKRRGERHDQLLVRIHTSNKLETAVAAEPVAEFLRQYPEVFTAHPL